MSFKILPLDQKLLDNELWLSSKKIQNKMQLCVDLYLFQNPTSFHTH